MKNVLKVCLVCGMFGGEGTKRDGEREGEGSRGLEMGVCEREGDGIGKREGGRVWERGGGEGGV